MITNFFQCMKFKLIEIVCQVRLILASYLFTRVREILYFQVDLEGSLDRLDPLPYFPLYSVSFLAVKFNAFFHLLCMKFKSLLFTFSLLYASLQFRARSLKPAYSPKSKMKGMTILLQMQSYSIIGKTQRSHSLALSR